MNKIAPGQWRPVGINSLEPNADRVVRSICNTLVVAGPGAGKTELLAQRACCLLQTNLCPYPQRILAISFKRDAAKNLKERVKARCGHDAFRFDSFTIDAFAKSLVDRFTHGLLPNWRPHAGYEVMTRTFSADETRIWLRETGITQSEIENYTDNEIRQKFEYMCHGIKIPYEEKNITPTQKRLGLRWWKQQLEAAPGKPSLTFPMINRLAAYLLHSNPKINAALHDTYSFIFLDEFQDTTSSQYDLIRAGFKGAESILTAVGDSKQRIMLWAGAMANVFNIYENDFTAARHDLLRNYRSAPELIAIQNTIALTLEKGQPPAEAANGNLSGNCGIFEFSSPEEEAKQLADLIENDLKNNKMKPRDFGIIVRQRTSDMIELLKAELSNRSISLRDESFLQDLLTEPIVNFLISALRLGTRIRDPEAWDKLTTELSTLLGANGSQKGHDHVNHCAILLVEEVRNSISLDDRPIHKLLCDLIEIVGFPAFRGTYRQYATGPFLQTTLKKFSEALEKSKKRTNSLKEAVDDLCGLDVIPAMTIHKSKGLEFHTIIFLGLEDSQWWSFANQPDEEKRSFFVAFSRAIERMYFTFCDVRTTKWGRKKQFRGNIEDLYTLLQKAGVQTYNFR